mmetsp:Transcript_74403/g.159466  ORF Transcript_74403/g.159466 Transcript_74403/m.159466 type:complete len:92 (+) Transcript_74403:181-456(+)
MKSFDETTEALQILAFQDWRLVALIMPNDLSKIRMEVECSGLIVRLGVLMTDLLKDVARWNQKGALWTTFSLGAQPCQMAGHAHDKLETAS